MEISKTKIISYHKRFAMPRGGYVFQNDAETYKEDIKIRQLEIREVESTMQVTEYEKCYLIFKHSGSKSTHGMNKCTQIFIYFHQFQITASSELYKVISCPKPFHVYIKITC